MKRKFSKIFGVGLALVLVLSLSLVMAVPVYAVHGLTPGASVDIDADTCGGDYTALNAIAFTDTPELVADDTFYLTAPDGFEFNDAVGTAIGTGYAAGDIIDLGGGAGVAQAPGYTESNTVATWTVFAAGTVAEGTITISGMEIRPTAAKTEIDGTGEANVTIGGSATTFDSGDAHPIDHVPGVHDAFTVVTENTGTEVAGVGFAIDLKAVDQFGNVNDDGDNIVAATLGITWDSTATNAPDNTPPTPIANGDQAFSLGAVTTGTDWTLVNVSETPTISAALTSDLTVNGTSDPLFVEGINLDSAFYAIGATATGAVGDAGSNLDPVGIETVTVQVTSKTDTAGILVDWDETGADTGIFIGSFPNTDEIPRPAEGVLVVADGDVITVDALDSEGVSLGLMVIPAEVKADGAVPTITALDPADGKIVYTPTPVISATLGDGTGSGIDTDSGAMTVNGAAVVATFIGNSVTYTVPSPLPAGSTVNVTVDVSDNVGNAAETASWSFSIAEKFNVSLDITEIPAAATTASIVATFKDVNEAGIEEDTTVAAKLFSVRVSLSGVGVDMDSGVLTGNGVSTHTFNNVTPEEAGEITATFIGTFGDGSVETKPLTISVIGFAVEGMPRADVGLGTTGDVSMTVTTQAGAAVNTGVVTITAPLAEGFEKNVDGIAGDESFKTIVIDGSTSKITYKDAGGSQVGDQEDITVIAGYYEVTAIKLAKVGPVDVLVEDVAGSDKAHFATAFSVLGNLVYSLSFEPTKLTAGVDLAILNITVTEADEPVTDVDTITIDGTDFTGGTLTNLGNGVYRVDPDLVSEAKTLDVLAKNADETAYGTATLEVTLPTVSYVITDAGLVERTLMLTGEPYTVTVTVTDALGEALDSGKVSLGSYADETFTALAGMPETLDATGQKAIAIASADGDVVTAGDNPGTLVWQVGDNTNAGPALVLEPAIAVEDLYYDVSPTEALVGVETTYTVTDNYLDVTGNRDVKIVTLGGDVVNKVTTPVGTFKYIAPEAGDYYVSIMVPEATWQDPITVTVSGVATIDLYEGATPIQYTGATTPLPDALTNISEITEIVWQRDPSTSGEWWLYFVEWGTGEITQMENGRVYIIVVSEDCIWELAQ